MDYDVIVIGGGPGGYVAAIRAAQLGLKVACVEKWINKQNKPALGGTCLNVGCIPSKALLESSEFYAKLEHQAKDFGVSFKEAKVDIKAIIARKDKIVSELTFGIETLFKANKIDWFQGVGTLLKDKKVKITTHDKKTKTIKANSIILASGSKPITIDTMPLVADRVVDSEGALNWGSVPKNLCIVGAGVIGLELGSVWRRLGAKVTLLQYDDLLINADKKVSQLALRSFKKQGLDIKTKVKVTSIKALKNYINVNYEEKDEAKIEKFDKAIIAVGRKPYTKNLLAKDSGVKLNTKGQIEVDEYNQTSVAGVYAIGDVVRGFMLAHKASEEGIMVAERITGQKTHINHDLIPLVIYTEPEIAWVGKTEDELKNANINYKTGEFPFIANGRAKTANSTEGFIKILADAKTDRVLGVHMFGKNVSELIACAVITMEFEGSTEDLQRTVFAHPSLSESIHEAALAVDNRAIHTINRNKS